MNKYEIEILYETNPKITFDLELTFTIILSSLLAILIIIAFNIQFILYGCILQTIIILIGIKVFLKRDYEVIKIFQDRIEVNYFFSPKKNYFIQIEEIDKTIWNVPERGGNYLQVYWKRNNIQKQINIPSFISVFDFAKILRVFREKGIVVNFKHSDKEVELFVEGLIDSLPMTNDMQILDKKNS